MSFDFGPMQNLSNVQASAKSCAGGGGNTGYFQRGKKEEEETVDLGFAKDYPEDSFVKEEDLLLENEPSLMESLKQMVLDLIKKIKALFEKK